jgi:hypothetical protein
MPWDAPYVFMAWCFINEAQGQLLLPVIYWEILAHRHSVVSIKQDTGDFYISAVAQQS